MLMTGNDFCVTNFTAETIFACKRRTRDKSAARIDPFAHFSNASATPPHHLVQAAAPSYLTAMASILNASIGNTTLLSVSSSPFGAEQKVRDQNP